MKNKILNEWEIINQKNEDGITTIYKVIRNDNTICAIKCITIPITDEKKAKLKENKKISDIKDIDEFFIKSLSKEASILKEYNGNPNILDFYDFSKEDFSLENKTNYYLRMEYAEDIESYFMVNGVSNEDVVKMAIDICSAIETYSCKKVVHNDIKTSNIFIDCNGNYKLGDFGIATIGDNKDAVMYGTPNYLSPEVYNNKPTTIASDIYSLGLVMYKLLSGTLPFMGDNIDEEKAFDIRMSGKEIPSISGINKELMSIISKACSYSINDRYQNANDMKKDLLSLTNLSSKKKKINFTYSKNQNTISVYDKTLMAHQTAINEEITKKRLSTIKKISRKKFLKRVFIIFILILILLSIGIIYARNRKCPLGKVNKNGMCVNGYYYCENGYSLNKNNKCQKTTESIDAKVTYTCKTGYILKDDVCVSSEILEPTFVYKCADGFSLNDKKCEKIESIDAIVTYNCPSGYVTAGDQCVTISNIDATAKYSCPDSTYTLSGTKCSKVVTKTVAANVTYYCDSGGTLTGTTCNYSVSPTYTWYTPSCSKGTYSYTDRMCHYTEKANSKYACSDGYVSDGKGNCSYTTTEVKTATVTYTCPNGYKAVGSICAKTTGISAKVKYNCPDGTTLKGTKCYSTISSDAVGMLDCPSGYVFSSSGCYLDDFPSPIKKYSCSRIYTLNGDKCEKYAITQAKVHYE